MFPEGVPSESGVMRRFGSPIFKMAQKDDIEVVPVTINGSGKLCENGIPVRRGKVEIHVHPPIVMKGRTVMEITNAAHSVVRGGLPAELRVEE